MLKKAIDNLKNGSKLEISKNGKNYRLPSNMLVLKFFYKIKYNFFKRAALVCFLRSVGELLF